MFTRQRCVSPMAAISLGVSEIEERLETVRRRLNIALAVRFGCISLTAVCLLLAIVVVSGLHHQLWARGLLVTVVLAMAMLAGTATALIARRSWMDSLAAAQIADRRAALAQ